MVVSVVRKVVIAVRPPDRGRRAEHGAEARRAPQLAVVEPAGFPKKNDVNLSMKMSLFATVISCFNVPS